MKTPTCFIALSLAFGIASSRPSVAADTWHRGEIVYTHTLAPTIHGQVPAGTHLVLDDGTDVDVSALGADDVFQKLVTYWSRERTDYRAAPRFVDSFDFKVRGLEARTGLRVVEIDYTANDMYGRHWKGLTHVIK